MSKKTKFNALENDVMLFVLFIFLLSLYHFILPLIEGVKTNLSLNVEPTPEKERLFYAYADSIHAPKKLTIEQLRRYKGQENLSDEEALEKIEGLYQLSLITYKIYSENGTGKF